MGMMEQLLGGEPVSPTDRALTRPGKALKRVQTSYLQLPEDERTPDVWLRMCEAAGVSASAANKVAAFAAQMFPSRKETTKPVVAKGRVT
jgi:hypothetical protein